MSHENTHHKVLTMIDQTTQTCWCGDWLAHWHYATGSTRDLCAIAQCGKTAQIGAHVQIDDRRLCGHWYVVPACRSHTIAAKAEPLFIDRRVALLPTAIASSETPVWWE